jgi:flagellar hook-associated protein 3 FlgL
MRLSTGTIYDTGTNAILQQQAELIKTQQQVATGRRILTPSDDPIAAAQAINLTQTISLNTQFSINRTSAASTLGLVEGVFEGVTSNLQDVRRLAVNAGNPTLTDTDRKSLTSELRGRLDTLVGLANATDGTGQFLFSGFQGSTEPFTQSGLNVQYNGDQGQRLSQVSATRQLAVSDSGSNIFERIKDGNGVFTTAASPTNNGTGVIDTGTVNNPASLTGDNYEIRFTVLLNVITYDVVDTTTAVTLSAANPYVDGANISFDGMQFSIEGEPADGDIFTVTPSTNQSIFKTVGDLITALEAPGSGQPNGTRLTNNLNTALTNLDHSLEQILTSRSSVGAKLQEIDVLESVGTDLEIQFEQTLSQLQDVDFAKALSDLNRQQVFLEAAQRSFVSITGLSLFDFI